MAKMWRRKTSTSYLSVSIGKGSNTANSCAARATAHMVIEGLPRNASILTERTTRAANANSATRDNTIKIKTKTITKSDQKNKDE